MDANEYSLMSQKAGDHWWWRARRNIIESVMLRWIKLNSSIELLEVGCGSGTNLSMLSQFGNVTGTEIEPQLTDYHRRELAELSVISHRIPEKLNRKFDIICMFDVLEHIPNDSEAIRWCFDHLEQGGWLTITVPAFPFLWSDHDVHVHHYRRYNKSKLQALIEKHFVTRKLSYFNFLLFAPIAIVRLCRRKSPSFSDTEVGAHGGGLASSLYKIFNLERRLINLINFPFGVSLIGVFQRIGNPNA